GAAKSAPATEAPAAKAESRPAQSAAAASPAARKILDEKGMSADDVSGSGRGGRVTKEDAVSAAKPAPAAAAAAPSARSVERDATDRPEERVPMTRLRARIAERLIQSKNENAIL